jgi:acetylornithine/succinyldiaminopimelate/putrescine aminotransferase
VIAFHGRTVGAASVTTSGTKFRTGFAPLMGGVAVSPFPAAIRLGMGIEEATDFALRELGHLLHRISDPRDTAAFIIEPSSARAATSPLPTGSCTGCGSAPTATGSCSSSTRSRPERAGPDGSGRRNTPGSSATSW